MHFNFLIKWAFQMRKCVILRLLSFLPPSACTRFLFRCWFLGTPTFCVGCGGVVTLSSYGLNVATGCASGYVGSSGGVKLFTKRCNG